MYEGVLGAVVIHKTIDRIVNDENTGLVAAQNLIVQDPPHKQELVKRGLQKREIEIKPGYWFVAGTCFAVKTGCLDWIKTFPAVLEDFHSVPSSRGFDLAHLLERYLCIAVEEKGYGYAANRVLRFRRGIKRGPEKLLQKYSGVRLYDLPYQYDPEFFLWVYDNRFVKYRVRKTKLRDLLYEVSVAGEVKGFLPLEKTYPFRYLQGDREAYLEYCDYHRKNGLPLMSEERFADLYRSISEKGYDPKHIIIVSEKNVLLDGQHRACCLADLYGLDFEIDVLEVVNINRAYLKKRFFGKGKA